MENKKKWNIEINFGGVNNEDIIFFTKHLAISLESGLTLVDGLDIVKDQAKGKMKSIVAEILVTIKSGESLYSSLKKHSKIFSPLYLNLIKSGEYSGNLEENLVYLAEHLEKSYELRKKVKSAMIYPVIVFVALIGLSLIVATFVFPKILPLFKSLNVELPLISRMLVYVIELFDKHGIAITTGVFAFMAFMFWFLKRNFIKPITHRILLKLPVFGNIAKNVNVQKFTHTLGILLTSGIPMDESLRITADTTENIVYKEIILYSVEEIRKGNTIAGAFASHPELFPKTATHMINVGEKTGNLDKLLGYLSSFYGKEIDSTVKNLSGIIEPILLIVIGIAVSLIAIAIIGPLYKITGSLRD